MQHDDDSYQSEHDRITQPNLNGDDFSRALTKSGGSEVPSRPSFEEIYMRMAGLVCGRSTCQRARVGCVITSEDYRKVLSIGYNGNASGLPNACDSTEPGSCGCVHAEMNAVINCDSPRQVNKIVFTTHSPCVMCAKFIVNLGYVQYVFYSEEYRVRDGLDVLRAARISHGQLEIKW